MANGIAIQTLDQFVEYVSSHNNKQAFEQYKGVDNYFCQQQFIEMNMW